MDYCNPFRLETIPVLEKAKELFPESDKPYYYLGWNTWLYTKNYDGAAECYANAGKLAPEKALYLEEQEHVLEAKAEAKKCFQTSLDLKNDNLWSKFMLETLK